MSPVLWPVFQPITALYQVAGQFKEFRFGDAPLPDTDAGQAGMSQEALDRFDRGIARVGEWGLGGVGESGLGWNG